jgi:hypothetical protein
MTFAIITAAETDAALSDAAERLSHAASAIDGFLEAHATVAHEHALKSGDTRWTELALALLGARRFTRPLMADADKQGAGDGRV